MALKFLNNGYFAGKVGIGDTTPLSKLEVAGSIKSTNYDTSHTSESGVTLGYNVTESMAYLETWTSKPLTIRTYNYQAFNISGNEAMRIDSNSNVGIGTTSPTTGKLVVSSSANQLALDTGTAGDGRLNIGHFSNGTFIGTYGDDGGGADLIRFGTHSGDERMRITSGGDVGIGTLPHTAGSTWRTFYVGSSATIISRQASSGTDMMLANNHYINSSNIDKRITTGGTARLFINQDVTRFQRSATGSADSTIAWSESMRIDSSGNVGIGSTNPARKLVVSNAGASGIEIQPNYVAGVNEILSFDRTSGATAYETMRFNGGDFQFQTSGSEKLRISSAGNVGINCIPSYKLQWSDGTRTGLLDTNIGTVVIGSVSDDALALYTNLTEKMRITSAGDVGIGAAPTTGYKLDVVRTSPGYSIVGRHATGGKVGIYNSTGDNGIGTVNNYAFNLFTNNSAPQVTIATTGNVGIGTTAPGSKLTVNGSFSADTGSFSNELTLSSDLRLQNNITILNKAQSAYISFATRNTTGSEVVMDLTNVGSINGGAAGPYLPLAGGTLTGLLKINPGTANNTSYDALVLTGGANSTSGSGAKMYLTGTVNDPLARGTIIEGLMTDNSNAHALVFSTSASSSAPTERMRITSGGNVGIGVTNPGAVLSVRNPTAGTSTFSLQHSTTSSIFDFQTGIANVTGNALVIKDVANSYDYLTLRDGNVGIGTTSPGAKLTVGDPGGATTRSIEIQGNSSATGMNGFIGYFSNGLYLTNNYYYDSAQTHPVSTYGQTNIACVTGTTTGSNYITFNISDHTDSNNAPDVRMRIMDNGNVGIGTTSPSAKLHVAGNVTATGNYTAGNSKIIYKAQRSGGAVAGDWSYDDATTDMSLGTSTSHSFSLKTGNTRALTINSSQNATFAGSATIETGINLESGTLVIKNATTDSNGLRIFQDSSDASKIYNNYNGTLQLGVNNTTALTLGSSQSATFGGDLNLPHGKISLLGGNNLTISGTAANHAGLSFATNAILPCAVSATNTNTIDLGATTETFKDLYLGGSITAGGGAAFSGQVDINSGNDLRLYRSDNATYARFNYAGGSVGLDIDDLNGDGINLQQAGVNKLRIETSGNATFAGNIALGDGKVVKWGNGNQQILGNNTSGLALYSNGERMRILTNGNVGIGTTSPNNILELSKTVSSAIGPILQLTNSQYTNANDSGSSIQFRGYTLWGPGSTNPRYSEINAINGSGSVPKRIEFKFYADADVKTPLAVLQTGNVGIGTTSPTSNLHVEGNATAGNYAAYIHNASGGGNVLKLYNHDWDISDYLLYATNGGTAANGYGFTVDGNSKVSIGLSTVATANAAADDLWLRSLGSNGITISSGNAQTGTLFFGDEANAAVAGFRYNHNTGDMAISAEDNITFACDNVGIGTTSPSAKLEVDGNIKLSSTAGQTATPSNIWLGNDFSNGTTRDKLKIYLYNSGTEQYGFTVGNQSDIQYHSNQEHDFYVANSLKLRINQSGNVGIGTTNPTEKLVVGGKVVINNSSPPNNFAQLNIGYAGSGETRAIDVHGSWSNGESKSISFTYSSSLDALVGQIKCRYNGPGSSIKWGRLYHSGISSAYTMELASTSTTTANLTVAGSIQMADDTAAASADKVGTMRYRTGTEYVEVTGTEIAVNGDFSSDTSWSKGTGWTIANGLASCDGTQTASSYLTQSTLPNPSYNKTYKVTFTISNYVSGSINVLLGGYQGTDGRSGNGTATQYREITQSLSNTILYVQAEADFVGSIDNLSVIEVTEEDASYADMCMQTGSATYEWVNIVRNTY